MGKKFSNSIKFITAVNLLSSERGATIKALGESLGISRRSVFRLLQTLEELGFPLVDEPSPQGVGKVYRLLESFVLKLPNITLPNPGLTENELAVINSILCFLTSLQEDTARTALKSIREKLLSLGGRKV
jgi:predicted DNA-binding transcriptional regulator YafY